MGESEFLAELDALGSVRHRNLVALRGYCITASECFLVLDYAANGNLDTALRARKPSDLLLHRLCHVPFQNLFCLSADRATCGEDGNRGDSGYKVGMKLPLGFAAVLVAQHSASILWKAHGYRLSFCLDSRSTHLQGRNQLLEPLSFLALNTEFEALSLPVFILPHEIAGL
jgi:hypothetical protein